MTGATSRQLAATLSLSALLACSSADTEPIGSAAHAALQADPDRYIVMFEPGREAQGRAALKKRGGELLVDLGEIGAVAARLPAEAASALAANPSVRSVEVDPVRVPLAETVPYGIGMVQADRVTDGGVAERTVCIIDSGYAVSHEDLPSGNVGGLPGWDSDGCGHGTHVAGTIAALGGNGVGVLGVDPSGALGLYIVSVFGDDCSWSYASDLIDAAYRCRDAGADVINMSLGCAVPGNVCYSAAEEAAFDDLYQQGLLSVAAASNDGTSWYSYPASYDSVISVAAVDRDGNHASFSNANDQVELAAPGVSVLSTVPMEGCTFCSDDSGYGIWSGTSMATPHVAAVAAVVWSHDASWTNQDVRAALRATTVDLGSPGYDHETGYGLIQAAAALDHLRGNDCNATEASEASCSDGADNDCDGLTDGDDADCQGSVCLPAGEMCSSDATCCSGRCRGRPGAERCR